jgi:Cu(I)/Ag(I) efflux system membrane fusion protein
MFVRATVHSRISNINGQELSPLLVPASAVLRTGKRAVVYVKKSGAEEPVFEGREVVLGPRAGDYYIIASGLKQGEEVVVKGNFKIDSAMQIVAKPSMMNPAGSVAITNHEHHGIGQVHSPLSSNESPTEKTQRLEADVTFLDGLQSVYDAYFRAQTALADDNLEISQEALASLEKTIMTLDKKALGLDPQSREEWKRISSTLQKVTQHTSHWSTIDEVRKAFEPISYVMLSIEEVFGHAGGGSYYEVYCPMAFDNKGAPWLQTDKAVNNPYFGASMLRCGEVKKEFKPKSGIESDHNDEK